MAQCCQFCEKKLWLKITARWMQRFQIVGNKRNWLVDSGAGLGLIHSIPKSFYVDTQQLMKHCSTKKHFKSKIAIKTVWFPKKAKKVKTAEKVMVTGFYIT